MINLLLTRAEPPAQARAGIISAISLIIALLALSLAVWSALQPSVPVCGVGTAFEVHHG